jgi:streptogramin lyase
LLYECLSGAAPFRRGSDAATLYAHLEDAPPTLPGLDDVLAKALAKEPSSRYQTCADLIDDARVALGISRSRRSLWPVAVAAVGLAVIAAALLAFFLTRSTGSGPTAQTGRLLRIDPASNRVTSAVAVGDGPAAVAAASGRVWVASYRDGTLWQLDAGTGAVTKVPALGRPYALAAQDGKIYAAALGPGQFDGNVTQFDAVTHERTGGIVKFTCSLTGGDYGIWVAGCPDVQQLRIDGSDVGLGATVEIPRAERLSAGNFREALAGMAEGEGAVWVVGDAADERLWRIDPQRHRISATIALGFPPGAVAVGNAAVWVTDQLGDRLARIDPATNRVAALIRVGRGARTLAFGAGSVWVAAAIEHTLTRVDPRTNRVVATIHVAASPQAVAVGDGSVWAVGDAR